MGSVAISYTSLSDASGEAKAVSKKLDRYADSIERTVYNKLNGYDGDHTGNISTAMSKAQAKITSLQDMSDSFSTYATDIKSLEAKCSEVDGKVARRVSSLTANFKARNNINNNPVVNAVSYFFTSVTNSSAERRWVSDSVDMAVATTDYFKESIEDWYDYEGGKQLIKGLAVAALELVAGIATIVAAAFASSVLLIVAGCILGAIAIMNAQYNACQELKAYAITQNGDPAAGRRESRVNTVQEGLRRSNNKWAHLAAFALDGIEFVCTVINIGNAGAKIFKAGKAFFAGKGVTGLKSLGQFVSGSWKNGSIMNAVKSFSFKKAGLSFLNNLKGNYLNPAKWYKSVKAFTGFGKDFGKIILNDDLIYNAKRTDDFKALFVKHVIEPGIAIPANDTWNEKGISLGDVTGSLRNGINGAKKEWKRGGEVLNYFLGDSSINVSIPEVHVPKVDVVIPDIDIPRVSVAY